MIDDLKLIKDRYGEKMMHLCRKEFSTILEYPGTLYATLSQFFYQSKFLYDDLIKSNKVNSFIKYIYSEIKNEFEKQEELDVDVTPDILLEKVGYYLYNCNSNEEVNSFEKYYEKTERLCTFNCNRLKSCYIFFAVKKDVDQIRRKDFLAPNREDLYGVSVISIQIGRYNHYISIKNRYNSTVTNPDATFNNNLDNIVPGLTKSFERSLNLKINEKSKVPFLIPGYVKALDGKFYKYNCEINNIYYCPDNIIIENFEPKQLDKSLYLVIDNVIIDLQNKKIVKKDKSTSFLDYLTKINKITIVKLQKTKLIKINDEIIIDIDNCNCILKYIDNNIKKIDDKLFSYSQTIEYLCLNNVEQIGNYFLSDNRSLKYCSLKNVRQIGFDFLPKASKLKELYLPSLEQIGCQYLTKSSNLKILEIKEDISNHFIYSNFSIKSSLLSSKIVKGRNQTETQKIKVLLR